MDESEFDKWWRKSFLDKPHWLHRSCYEHGFERAAEMCATRAAWLAVACFVIGAFAGRFLGL